MRKNKSLFCMLSVILLIACGTKEGDTKILKTIELPVVSIPTKTVTAYTSYPTSLEGVVNSEVYAKISGYIKSVLVDEGEKVKKGQTLFVLETESLDEDAAGAKASIRSAQIEVDKLIPLVKKNIISEVQVNTAKAQLEAAKDAYNSIIANISYGSVKSPVDGYVGEIRLRNGSLVGPTSDTPLTTISQTNRVYAFFSLNERAYLDFMMGTPGKDITEKIKNMPDVKLELANDSIYDQDGTVETINSQVDEETGTVSFRAVFDNPQRLLANGNSGTIRVPKTYTKAVVVPKESTYEQQGDIYIYKVNKDSTVILSKIAVIADVDNMYVIKSGAKVGDRIIASGADKLKPNDKIVPQETPFDSIAQPIGKSFR